MPKHVQVYADGSDVWYNSVSQGTQVKMIVLSFDDTNNTYDLKGKGDDDAVLRQRKAAPAKLSLCAGSAVAAAPASGGEDSRGVAASEASAAPAAAPASGGEDSRGVAEFAACTGMFLRRLRELKLASGSTSLPAVLSELFPPSDNLKRAITRQIPWDTSKGYTTFLRAPKTSAKGHTHIAMLGYQEEAYPGNGIYVVDAITLLELQAADLSSHVVRLRPRGEGELGTFGWLPDGDIANGTRAFALAAMGLYATVGQWQPATPWPEEVMSALGDVAWTGDIPKEVVAALSDIRVRTVVYASSQQRLVQNLVDSAINHKVNRSIEDPIFLSREMRRSMVGAQTVKTVMALYKQRCLANPALHLKASVEEAVVRFMQHTKVSIGTQDVIADHVREQTWQRCAFTCHAFMAGTFVIGAKLGTWFDQLLQNGAIQSAQGQLLAVQIAIKQRPAGSSIQQQCFTDLCTACGLWVWLREKILPLLALGSHTIMELEEHFEAASGAGSLRAELLALRSREPECDLKNHATCADWVLKHVGPLRTARDAEAEKANQVARQNPALLLSQVESAQMATGVFIGQVTLDVNQYREASRLFVSDDAKASAEFETLRKHHIMNVKAAQYFPVV